MRHLLRAGLYALALFLGAWALLVAVLLSAAVGRGLGNLLATAQSVGLALLLAANAAWAWRRAGRLGDPRLAVSDALEVVGLKTVYDRERLGERTPEGSPDGRYAKLGEAELLDVYSHVNPRVAPEAATQLLLEVHARVRREYLPDGRRLPPSARGARPMPAPAGATCPEHQAPAALSCARCGTFVCGACVAPTGAHCQPCLETLLATPS